MLENHSSMPAYC